MIYEIIKDDNNVAFSYDSELREIRISWSQPENGIVSYEFLQMIMDKLEDFHAFVCYGEAGMIQKDG